VRLPARRRLIAAVETEPDLAHRHTAAHTPARFSATIRLVRGLHGGTSVGTRWMGVWIVGVALSACSDDPGGTEVDAGPVDAGPDGMVLRCDDDDHDDDGDGFAGCFDCDDTDPDISPAVNEGYCCSTNLDDGIDNDCDGEIDETPFLQGCACWEGDSDNDGYLDQFDCDPNDATVNPGITEGQWCSPDRHDGKDNDCDGDVDESEETRPCDADYDGSPEEEDCDDTDYWVGPQWSETCCRCPNVNDMRSRQCDGKDNDCDGTVDESPVCDCNAPDADYDGYREGDDCDDTDANVSPGMIECCCPGWNDWWCNGRDDDCDGEVDETSASCCGQYGYQE